MRAHLTPVSGQEHELKHRHQIEEKFHDQWAKSAADTSARMDFYEPFLNDKHFQILLEAAGCLHGKCVLDFGCGPGATSRMYAEMGAARVEGFDISGENIRIATKNAERDGLDDRVFFRRLAAEEIDYPDQSFDVVLGKAILHHTDLQETSRQLYRVLRPGGAAYFLEPLAHNPLLNLFRRLTPWRRTPTERPLRIEDLACFRRYFDSVTCRGFYLLPLVTNLLLLLTGWRELHVRTMSLLLRWEEPLLERFPSLQKYCWTALLIFRKNPTEAKAAWQASVKKPSVR